MQKLRPGEQEFTPITRLLHGRPGICVQPGAPGFGEGQEAGGSRGTVGTRTGAPLAALGAWNGVSSGRYKAKPRRQRNQGARAEDG